MLGKRRLLCLQLPNGSAQRRRLAVRCSRLLGRGAYGGQFVNQLRWEHGCTWIDALPELYRSRYHWRVLKDDIQMLVWMIRRDGLDVGPDNSQMLCEVDPKRFVGSEGIPMSFKNSCRQEEMRSGIRMTADLAMDCILLVSELALANAFSHRRRRERIPQIRRGRAQPHAGLFRNSSKQAHKVLNLDRLPDERRGCVPV